MATWEQYMKKTSVALIVTLHFDISWSKKLWICSSSWIQAQLCIIFKNHTLLFKTLTPCLLTPCPLTNISCIGRLPTPCRWPGSAAWGGCHMCYSRKVWFSQITPPLVEPRAGVILTHIQKTFTWLAIVARWPGLRVSLEVHQSQEIAYDPVFAIGDWERCLMGTLLLISPTISIKLCFIMCGQPPLLSKPQTLRSSMLITFQIPWLEK